MKHRILSIVIFLLITAASFAQMQVTKFLRLPVDGFKNEMIQKLQAKGFQLADKKNSMLTGEFNGVDVNVFVITNNNKVCRIMLCDQNTLDETDIKIRFNKLLSQFENNTRYDSHPDNKPIADDVDLSFEMGVKKNVYEALFFQKIDYSIVDTVAMKKTLLETANDTINKYMENIELVLKDSNGNSISEEQIDTLKETLISGGVNYALLEMQNMMPVWFRIEESFGKYYICMFYDNEYNRANGEDL